MGLAGDSISEIKQLFKSILGIIWLGICFAYVIWWSISDKVRRAFTGSIILILVSASILSLLELTMSLFGKHLELFYLPIWAELVIVFMAFLMVFHRFQEWRQFRKESIFAVTVSNLFEQMSTIRFEGQAERTKDLILKNFIQKILASFESILGEGKKIRLNVMLLSEVNVLRVFYYHPSNSIYEDVISFPIGHGGAGYCCKNNVTVYFPAIMYRHGIVFGSKLKLLKEAYETIPGAGQPFKSVLCVPIKMGKEKQFGVLNIDSTKQNAFKQFDVDVAQVAASAIATALDKSQAQFLGLQSRFE